MKYRNNEERMYNKALKPVVNMLAYQEGILEEAEKTLEEAREGNQENNARTQAMKARRQVLYIRKLHEALTSCEPGVCRDEGPSAAELESWNKPLG